MLRFRRRGAELVGVEMIQVPEVGQCLRLVVPFAELAEDAQRPAVAFDRLGWVTELLVDEPEAV